MKINFLIIIAIFLVLLPWLGVLDVGINNQVMVDGITTSSITVMTITLVFSLISWFLFSWATHSIKSLGAVLAIIAGASIVIPFIQILGPMAAVIIGIVAGFVAFMFQKSMKKSTKNCPAGIASITLAASYFVLVIVVLAAQSSHIWDTGNGIGAWSGTPEGIEESGFDNIFGNNIGFEFFLAIIPSLTAMAFMIRGKNEN